MKALCVTGFVDNPFPARHLSQTDCRGLGDRLKAALGDRLLAFDQGWSLPQCWAHRLLEQNPGLVPSCASPPADRFASPADMVRSNIVLLQRYFWMAAAAAARPDVDVLAWVEYTVLKQRGVTGEVLAGFADALERTPCDAVTLPVTFMTAYYALHTLGHIQKGEKVLVQAGTGVKKLEWLRDAIGEAGWVRRQDRPTKTEIRDAVRSVLNAIEAIACDCAEKCGEHLLDKILKVLEQQREEAAS